MSPGPAPLPKSAPRSPKVVETGEPSISLNERVIEGEPHKFEVLRVPLSEDGAAVTMILTCAMYFDRPRNLNGGLIFLLLNPHVSCASGRQPDYHFC